MSIIGRYIARSYLQAFATCLGAFLAIYLVIDFLEKIGRYSKAGASFVTIAQVFACRVPEIICQVAPLAVLMGTVLTIGGLARHSELTAMRSCGIGLFRIGAPILAVAAATSVILILAGEVIVPAANDRAHYLEDVVIGRKSPSTFFRQNNIWYRSAAAILQARLFEPATATLRGVVVWELDQDQQPTARLEAESATPRDGGWLLHQVNLKRLAGGQVRQLVDYRELPVSLDLTISELKVVEKSADNMGFLDLARYCRKLERGGYDTTRYRALLHSKLSLPFAALIMAFLGIPFAIRSGRSGGIAIGVGLSLGIGFCYFVVNATLLSFGQGGALPPLLAAWAANAIFAALGSWLVLTVDS